MLPLDELARRFDLSTVAHSAGVFDEDKLAWVNRHYLKARRSGTARRARGAVSARARRWWSASRRRSRARMAAGHRAGAGVVARSAVAAAGADADDLFLRCRQRSRCATTFDASSTTAGRARSWRRSRRNWRHAPRLTDRDMFRAAAGRVKEKTGQEGPGAVSSDPRGVDRRDRGSRARSAGSRDRSRDRPLAREMDCSR